VLRWGFAALGAVVQSGRLRGLSIVTQPEDLDHLRQVGGMLLEAVGCGGTRAATSRPRPGAAIL